MSNTTTFTAHDVRNFWAYFDIADQLYGVDDSGYQWTTDDFTESFVKDAMASADRNSLPWPPERPVAEEFALANKWVYNQ